MQILRCWPARSIEEPASIENKRPYPTPNLRSSRSPDLLISCNRGQQPQVR